jgi:Tfp pilus assembly protein PilF
MTIGPKHRASIAVTLALVCAACAAPTATDSPDPARPATESAAGAAREKSRAEQDFKRGVKSYEDGDYNSAARQLQSALSLGLPDFHDQAIAHKYLAFIACAAGRQRPCRDEFRKAFEADSNFNLTPAEAGHPVWGPVFRSVRAETDKVRPK